MPTPEHQRVLDRFPPLLKALVEEELRAGNRIIAAGGGHPAPPIGDTVMLERDLTTCDPTTRNDLVCRTHCSSLYHQEVTDRHGHFRVLTAPLPPPAAPDMDAIRRANEAPRPIASGKEPATWHVEMDVRGEMLILHEPDRRTDIIWTWNGGHLLHRSTLSAWWYPAEKRSQPMTAEEARSVVERFMAFARGHISTDTRLKD